MVTTPSTVMYAFSRAAHETSLIDKLHCSDLSSVPEVMECSRFLSTGVETDWKVVDFRPRGRWFAFVSCID